MSAPLTAPTPIFTLSIYEEDAQVKSVYCFRDPACSVHRQATQTLLRRALVALDGLEPLPPRVSHERGRFSKA